jgi:hypothetical protein
MTDGLGREDFAARVGTTVPVDLDGHDTVPLRMSHLRDFGDGDGRRFSVFFDGPAESFLPQGIHRLRLDGDVHEVFVVPVAREGDRFVYEAAFNRDGA